MAKGKKARGSLTASNQGQKRKPDITEDDGPDKVQKTRCISETETTSDSETSSSCTNITGTSRCSSFDSLSHYSSTSNTTQIHLNPVAGDTPTNPTETGNPENETAWTVKNKKPRARTHPADRPVQPPPNPDTDVITILLRPVQEDQTLHTLRPSSLWNFYKSLPNLPLHQRKIRRGGLATDFPLETPIESLLAIKQIDDFQVTATLPSSSKRTSGCIRGDFPDDEDLLAAYKMHDNPPAASISRLGKSKVYKITFTNDCLPATIKIAFTNFRVQPYFYAPTRCFNCHRFNHKAGDCRGKTTCGHCGQLGHRFRDCPKTAEPPRCANCAGNHSVTDKSCTHRTFEIQVKKLQAKENVPTYLARAAVSRSYAAVLKTSTNKNSDRQKPTVTVTSNACQTDPELPETVPPAPEVHPETIPVPRKSFSQDTDPLSNLSPLVRQKLTQKAFTLVDQVNTGSLPLTEFIPKLLLAVLPALGIPSPTSLHGGGK